MNTHICPQCSIEYPLTPEYWFRNSANSNGFDSWCKSCKKKQQAKIRAERRANHVINPDNLDVKTCTSCGCDLPPTREYFYTSVLTPDGLKADCIECTKAYNREYHQKRYSDPTIRKKTNRQNRKWHNENKEFKNANVRKKYHKSKEHRDMIKAAARRRRARKMNAEGSHTLDDIKAIYNEQDGRCYYCGIPIDLFGDDMQVDHIMPLSRGGSDYPDNLCCSCEMCNKGKGNRTIAEWESVRGW